PSTQLPAPIGLSDDSGLDASLHLNLSRLLSRYVGKTGEIQKSIDIFQEKKLQILENIQSGKLNPTDASAFKLFLYGIRRMNQIQHLSTAFRYPREKMHPEAKEIMKHLKNSMIEAFSSCCSDSKASSLSRLLEEFKQAPTEELKCKISYLKKYGRDLSFGITLIDDFLRANCTAELKRPLRYYHDIGLGLETEIPLIRAFKDEACAGFFQGHPLAENVQDLIFSHRDIACAIEKKEKLEIDLKSLSSSLSKYYLGFPTASTLIHTYLHGWNPVKKSFDLPPFDDKRFCFLVERYTEANTVSFDVNTTCGWAEKKLVDTQSSIFVRADLHGDMKSLIENLNELRNQGLLDQEFRCLPGTHLVFLGDYTDRGNYSLQILELLITLKKENPENVTLLKGNHENAEVNLMYCGSKDLAFQKFLEDPKKLTLLENFYSTLPLSLYLGESSPSGQIEYSLFSHALFELYFDPEPMLSDLLPYQTMPIPLAPTSDFHGVQNLFSPRVKQILKMADKRITDEYIPSKSSALLENQSQRVEQIYKNWTQTCNDPILRKQLKREAAAQRIYHLAFLDFRPPSVLAQTTTNWGDIASEGEASLLLDPGSRNWKLSPQDIKNYFKMISTENHKVKYLFRGHEHESKHHHVGAKLVATTLSVGMDSPLQVKYPHQADLSYILTTAPKIKDWTKKAIMRASGDSFCETTDPVPLRSETC
ncbi:MAG: serine/threonine protein phosphatase, partial [Chlamydiae bacterium]|nr:serine/threonine protein phosphatase [Chlamydiota bacterium]